MVQTGQKVLVFEWPFENQTILSGFQMAKIRWLSKMAQYSDGRFQQKLNIRKPDLYGFLMFTVQYGSRVPEVLETWTGLFSVLKCYFFEP